MVYMIETGFLFRMKRIHVRIGDIVMLNWEACNAKLTIQGGGQGVGRSILSLDPNVMPTTHTYRHSKRAVAAVLDVWHTWTNPPHSHSTGVVVMYYYLDGISLTCAIGKLLLGL